MPTVIFCSYTQIDCLLHCALETPVRKVSDKNIHLSKKPIPVPSLTEGSRTTSGQSDTSCRGWAFLGEKRRDWNLAVALLPSVWASRGTEPACV